MTDKPAAPRHLWPNPRVVATALLLVALLVVAPFAVSWLVYRFTHSITEDAFVESHLINIGTQQVSGYITQALVEEHDRIEAGQLLCRIDPVPYRDQVELARSKLYVAEASLATEQAALKRLSEEVPVRIAIAEKDAAIARADESRAEKNHEFTERDVDKQIREAKAGVEAAEAVLVNAEEDYKRYSKLLKEKSVPERKFEEATRVWKTATAERVAAKARLARAEAGKLLIQVALQSLESSQHTVQKTMQAVELAKLGNLQIEELKRQVQVKAAQVEEARRALAVAETNLKFTRIIAPFNGVVAKRYRRLGDFAPVGAPIMTVYNTELKFVTANMEETRLEGISAGNWVRLDVDAFSQPFRGRVVFIGKATGAKFSLVPRDVSTGEFTKVVQRVPIRIWIEKDERWDQLVPGLSVTVAVEHGPGDPDWARKEAEAELLLETGPLKEPPK